MNKRVLLLMICLLSMQLVFAQEKADTEKKEAKKSTNFINPKWMEYVPSGIRLGTDISRLGGILSNPDFRQYEMHGDIDFGKYFLTADWGSVNRPRSLDGLSYVNAGSYFRVGLDYNITPYLKEKSVFFAGLRYAQANFSETATLLINSPIWGDGAVEQVNESLRANWLEFTLGLKVHLAYNIFLGYTVRYRANMNVRGFNNLVPYEIPGYGRASETSNFGLNYHFFYRIPVRRTPEPVKKKK